MCVNTIANYENFNVSPHFVDGYVELVKYAAHTYDSVTHYTTSTFLWMKRGDELQKRGVRLTFMKAKKMAERQWLSALS